MSIMQAEFTHSIRTLDGINRLDEVEAWLDDCRQRNWLTTTPLPLSELEDWSRESATGDWVHRSGRFFRITGIQIEGANGPTRQPIIEQPEIGILGFLLSTFDGVVHLLVQAKIEPGNPSGIQLAPTIQATKSNFSRVHGGSTVPYFEEFRSPAADRVLVDTLQSEQGWWFYQKRNRNIVVWTGERVDARADFCWMTLGQLFHFLEAKDVVNMDSRSVLGCLTSQLTSVSPPGSEASLSRLQTTLTALNTARTTTSMVVHRISLNEVWNWHDDGEKLRSTNPTGPFEIVGRGIHAAGREGLEWSQPLLRPCDERQFDLIFRRTADDVECLLSLTEEPGLTDIVELGPTERDQSHGFPLGQTKILHDQVQSEEGGRFLDALSRYVVRELVDVVDMPAPQGKVWVSLRTIQRLLVHPRYLTVEARTLALCLQSVLSRKMSGSAIPPTSRSDDPAFRNVPNEGEKHAA
mgnify:FL=1